MGWLVDGHDVVRLALPAPGRFSAAGGDAFGGAPVLRSLKESQLLHDLVRAHGEPTRGSCSDEVDEAEQVELRDGVQRAREPPTRPPGHVPGSTPTGSAWAPPRVG